MEPGRVTAAIAIICKAPVAGASKTRLIPSLGAERAAGLSRAFLVDLAATIDAVGEAVGARGYAVCSPEGAVPQLAAFLPASFGYVVETHPVLGAVLDAASTTLLARGHDCALLVNGDSPTLPAAILADAIERLRRPGSRVVFGPALDGGYTLVGLKQPTPGLFADIPWSTAAVLARSLDRAADLALAAELTAPWYDVDDAESFGWLQAELDGVLPAGLRGFGRPVAAATRAVAADAR